MAKQNKKAHERPIVVHEHTKGDWKIRINRFGPEIFIVDEYDCILADVRLRKIGVDQEQMANAILISKSPQLLQIAEMYFDGMKGTEKEGGIAWNLVLNTLKSVK